MCRLQQELLAKMISDLCPTEVEEEPAPGLPHFVDENSIESEMEDKEQSMFGRWKLAFTILLKVHDCTDANFYQKI